MRIIDLGEWRRAELEGETFIFLTKSRSLVPTRRAGRDEESRSESRREIARLADASAHVRAAT